MMNLIRHFANRCNRKMNRPQNATFSGGEGFCKLALEQRGPRFFRSRLGFLNGKGVRYKPSPRESYLQADWTVERVLSRAVGEIHPTVALPRHKKQESDT